MPVRDTLGSFLNTHMGDIVPTVYFRHSASKPSPSQRAYYYFVNCIRGHIESGTILFPVLMHKISLCLMKTFIFNVGSLPKYNNTHELGGTRTRAPDLPVRYRTNQPTRGPLKFTKRYN